LTTGGVAKKTFRREPRRLGGWSNWHRNLNGRQKRVEGKFETRLGVCPLIHERDPARPGVQLRDRESAKHDWKKTMNKKILERIKKLERRIPQPRKEVDPAWAALRATILYCVAFYLGDPNPREPIADALARALL
jgi:hypothetical protein